MLFRSRRLAAKYISESAVRQVNIDYQLQSDLMYHLYGIEQVSLNQFIHTHTHTHTHTKLLRLCCYRQVDCYTYLAAEIAITELLLRCDFCRINFVFTLVQSHFFNFLYFE